jgi:hypothetical protein
MGKSARGSLESWFGEGRCVSGARFLQFLSCGGLACEKKSLWIFTLAAELERAEVLKPRALRNDWARLDPETEQVEIFQADVAFVHALNQMSADGGRKPRPGFDARHLFTEDQPPQLVAQALNLSGVVSCTELFGQIEECLFFLPTGFDALFNEFDEDAVVAQSAPFGYALYLARYLIWEGYAAANLLGRGHGTSLHHFGALPFRIANKPAGIFWPIAPAIYGLENLKSANRPA